jgi:hypothetical protein
MVNTLPAPPNLITDTCLITDTWITASRSSARILHLPIMRSLFLFLLLN